MSGFEKIHFEMLGVDSDLHSRANSIGEKTPRKMLSFTGFQANEKENVVNADLMSVGIILYMLLVGNPPFQGKSSKKLIEEARVGYISFTYMHRHVSQEAKDFVKKLSQKS